MTTGFSDTAALADLAAAALPGRTSLGESELTALAAATSELLRVSGDAGRSEYARFLNTASRGIAVDTDRLASVHRGATVLVTGGTGCIGSALLRELLPLRPARVVSISRGLEGRWPRHDGVDYVRLDIRNAAGLGELVRTLRPDIVYHLAAQHDPGLAEREVHRTLSTNVTGTANVIAACREVENVRLACASTGKALRPFTRDIYSASKKMMEWLLGHSAPDTAMKLSAVRFTHVVDNSIILRRLHQWCAQDQPIRLHSVDAMFYLQSAREAAQLLMSSVLEARTGRLSLAAIRDLGWPASLLELALGVLASAPTKSTLYVCGFEVGYERAPYPGLYDPLVSGSASPLFNAIEAAQCKPADSCSDLDLHRPASRTSVHVAAEVQELSRAAAVSAPATELRALVESCGWAMWGEEISSTPLPVLRRHAVLLAGKPLTVFSPDDRCIRSMVDNALSNEHPQPGQSLTAMSAEAGLERSRQHLMTTGASA